MPYPMTSTDQTAPLQAALDSALAARRTFVLPAGGHRLVSTGLGYGSNARIAMVGDLYNDHGPQVGTHYCLTNRTRGRVRNVTVLGQGGAFVGADGDHGGATRKGLGIVDTDGFSVVSAATAGPLTGFGMEVKNSSGGYLRNLKLFSDLNRAGADGLHFFGACAKVTGSDIRVRSGDDALSFTAENHESIDALMERITLSRMTLDSAAFSCIKFFTSATTGRATIRNIHLTGIKGRITRGPTGCPLAIQNNGVRQGCVIEDITIENADLDFGAATQDGPCAFLTDANGVTIRNTKLRGRRNGQFLRAIRCRDLTVTGEVWETIPGSAPNGMVQLEQCGNYRIDLIVRSATGERIGSIKVANSGVDTVTRYIGITGG